METIDALSFDKESSFDRIVGCTYCVDNDIYDINHGFISSNIAIMDNMNHYDIFFEVEARNGINEFITWLKKELAEDKQNTLEFAMSNDNMSLLIFTCGNVIFKGLSFICPGKYQVRLECMTLVDTLESTYPKQEYFRKRE